MLMGELGSWCWPAGQEDRRAFCARAKEGGYILKPKSLVRDGKPCSWLSLSHRYSRQVAGAGRDAGPVEQQRSPWGFQLIRKTSSSLPSLAPPCALTLSLQPPPQTRLRARPGRAPGCAGALVGVSLPGHCGPPPLPSKASVPPGGPQPTWPWVSPNTSPSPLFPAQPPVWLQLPVKAPTSPSLCWVG